MKPMLRDRLLQRELGQASKNTTVKGLYGDRSWVENLDIVNELGGHSGCVNALRYFINISSSLWRHANFLNVPQLVDIWQTTGIWK